MTAILPFNLVDQNSPSVPGGIVWVALNISMEKISTFYTFLKA